MVDPNPLTSDAIEFVLGRPTRKAAPVSVEPWVTLQDVAKHLQVAEDTVHRWIDRKGLPAIKAGRVWRFKLTEVDAWLRSGGSTESQDTSTQEEP